MSPAAQTNSKTLLPSITSCCSKSDQDSNGSVKSSLPAMLDRRSGCRRTSLPCGSWGSHWFLSRSISPPTASAILARERPQALLVHVTPIAVRNLAEIAKLAVAHRLPSVAAYKVMAQGGLLMSYGPDRVESWRRAAIYIDKLLRGESPSNLPVEQPTKFELVINIKTATALGLTIPPTLLARADEV